MLFAVLFFGGYVCAFLFVLFSIGFFVFFPEIMFGCLCFFFVLSAVLFFVPVFGSLCFFFVLFAVLFFACLFASLCFFFVVLSCFLVA